MKTAIFYASSTGNTQNISEDIAKELGDIETFDISEKDINDVLNYEKIIFGISTWGEGELQDDWDEIWDEFTQLDFSNKTVALFGLGDQDSYADEFVDALGIMYEVVQNAGAKVIGFTSTDEYDFDESKALVDGKFCGLVIDEDNQEELTTQRIKDWTGDIKNEIL